MKLLANTQINCYDSTEKYKVMLDFQTFQLHCAQEMEMSGSKVEHIPLEDIMINILQRHHIGTPFKNVISNMPD